MWANGHLSVTHIMCTIVFYLHNVRRWTSSHFTDKNSAIQRGSGTFFRLPCYEVVELRFESMLIVRFVDFPLLFHYVASN